VIGDSPWSGQAPRKVYSKFHGSTTRLRALQREEISLLLETAVLELVGLQQLSFGGQTSRCSLFPLLVGVVIRGGIP